MRRDGRLAEGKGHDVQAYRNCRWARGLQREKNSESPSHGDDFSILESLAPVPYTFAIHIEPAFRSTAPNMTFERMQPRYPKRLTATTSLHMNA